MSFGVHVARIWRRRFLVAVIALLAALLAVGVSMRHKGTQYTGIATLITVSQNSSPDQTASLATGYVGTFIQPSFQRMLQAKLGLPADVSLTAQTAAQSPIIFISATAPDAATAQRAAGAAAAEFLREVNANLQAGRDNLIDQMRRAVQADTKATTGAIRVPAEIDMQNRINGVNADPTNDLQILQSNAGVTAKSSGAKKTIAVALVGGLIFGCLLAWVLGAASRRLSSPAELMEKARIEPLVVIPPGGGTKAKLQRERQLRQLAATVALLDLPKPAVVAVAPVEPMPGADDIAESLARYRADHGARTVLVHADGAPVPPDAVEGDIESVAVRWSLTSESGGRMREVFPVDDTQDVRRLGMEHLGRLVTSLRGMADLVVIRSPAVSESAESYMVCAVADRTLLVAGAGSSADSVVAVRDQMERVGVSLLGVAFVERPRRHRAESGSNDRPVSGPGAPDRPGPAPSATRAASHNSTADSRSMDMSARAVGALGTRSMGPTAPAARQATTGDTGDETLVFVKGPDADARLPESAAAPDASPEWPDEATPSTDPKSGISRI
jgi:succinoglycan biosynthesis transport protein ExoP